MTEKKHRKGHLHGYEWRQSKRALEKKARAKRKRFGIDDDESQESPEMKDFIISKEKVGEFGVVAAAKQSRFGVLFRGEYLECGLDKDAPFHLGKLIVVGDYVTIRRTENGYAIHHLVKRDNALSRLRRDSTHWGVISARNEHIIAANIDVAVIVASVKNPPFHPKFIDRYLVLVQHGAIQPLICLNKCDLGQDGTEILKYYQKLGMQVVKTSAEHGTGIVEFQAAIRGQSAVLVGHSGVGKSSLINRIYPEASLKVGQVGEKSGKGRHTTTTSELLVWEEGSYIIDTPGIRSLGMWDIQKEDLQLYFEDIGQLAEECRFGDCLHDNVDTNLCAVIRAVHNGSLPAQRYESYLKILREL